MAQPMKAGGYPPPDEWLRLERGLHATPRTMILHYLKYRGLPAGVNDTSEEIVERVHQYILDGRLGLDEMFGALIDFQEHGSKTVSLYRIGRSARMRLGQLTLPNRLRRLSEAEIVRRPSRPTVSYSYMDANVLKVSWVETHQNVVVDAATGVRLEPIDRVAVLEVDRTSGSVALRLDPAGRLNPHGGKREYHQYYVDQAEAILKTRLMEVDLTRKLLDVETSELVRLPQGTFLVKDGRVELANQDYRQMEVYAQVKDRLLAKHSGRYVWLARDQLSDEAARSVSPPGLLRNVLTEIQAAPARVRFTSNVIKDESDRVLERLF